MSLSRQSNFLCFALALSLIVSLSIVTLNSSLSSAILIITLLSLTNNISCYSNDISSIFMDGLNLYISLLNSLQVFVINDAGGGTGFGLDALILERIAVDYEETGARQFIPRNLMVDLESNYTIKNTTK